MQLTSFFLFMLTASVANAANMTFDPYFGIGRGTVTVKAGTVSRNDSSIVPLLGARLGFVDKDMFLGVDTSLAYWNKGETITQSFSHVATGLGVGYTMDSLPVRWYVVADLFHSLASESSTINSGGGGRFGLGYYLNLDKVINLELKNYGYTEGLAGVQMSTVFLSYTTTWPFDYPKEPWRNRYYQEASMAEEAPTATPEESTELSEFDDNASEQKPSDDSGDLENLEDTF